MDTVATLERVVAETRRVVNNVEPDQLGNKTLCTEWTVRDVINHITGGAAYFATAVEEGSVSDELTGQLLGGGDNLGDDYNSAFNAATDRAIAAFSAPGVLEKTVKFPFGEMPAGVGLNIAIFDVATHACDIAQATGQEINNTELLETALEVGRQTVPSEARSPGFMDAERPCPDDAPPMQRVLAFAGRAV